MYELIPDPAATTNTVPNADNSPETSKSVASERRKADALWRELTRTREKLQKTERALEDAQRELREVTRLDELTGLPNYRAFVERMREEVRRASRFSLPLSILLLDLDNIDAVHHAANVERDDIICQISELLQDSTRAIDTVARYGRKQFGVILPNTPQDGATLLAERLLLNIETHPIGDSDENLSACFGVTTLTSDCMDGKMCIGEAYKAMRYSSMSGRNRVTHAQQAQIDRVVPWGSAPSVRLIEGSGGFSSIEFDEE